MRSLLRGLVYVIGVVTVIAVVLRLTVLDTWRIPDDEILGLSIAPTLGAGDLVVLWTVGDRGFGELVRCADPEDPQRWVVGRVVGIGGDKIEVAPNGVVSVNGTRYNVSDRCLVSSFELRDAKGNTYEASCSRVEMAGGWHFRATVSGESTDRPVKETVENGRFYLLSDNRSLHDDSRDFGTVEAAACKDLVAFRLWDREGFFAGGTRFEYVH